MPCPPSARPTIRRLFILVATLAGLAAASAETHAASRAQANRQSEAAIRLAIIEETGANLSGGHFDSLERMAEDFRRAKARTPSGTWKMGWFYKAFETIGLNAPTPSATMAMNASLQTWLQSHPGSPTPYIALGHFIYWRTVASWRYRLATSNARPNWEPYRQGLAETYDFLLRAKPIAARDPEWYVVMENLGRLLEIDLAERHLLVEEGLDQEPHYHRLYFAAAEGLLPKWGGSHRMVEAFANEAVTRTREVDGESLYARIYWHLARIEFGPDLFRETGAEWDAISRGFRDIAKAYPEGWNLNAFALFACAANDFAKAGQILGQIGDGIIPELWPDRQTLEACQSLGAGSKRAAPRPAQRVSYPR